MNNELAGTPAEEKKNPVGRPSKYKNEFCQGVIDHMSQGLSLESYAGVISVHKDTLYEWMKQNEEFSDSVKRGFGKCQLLWEKMGIQGAAGKLKGFNAESWKFNMSNRFKWKMREDVTSDDKVIESPRVIIDTKPKEVKHGSE